MYLNKNIYAGEWNYNNENGKGKMWAVDGSVYEGNFQSGRRYGQGSLTLANKYNYTGEF